MLKLRKGPIFKILDKFEISGNTMTPDLDNSKTSVKHVVCNEKLLLLPGIFCVLSHRMFEK
jgi:hypothetical protein